MNKQQAVEKLQSIFGEANAIGVAHSVIVELSKYIIILLFAMYTWHCFTVFIGRDQERKEEVYARQRQLMYCIHFIATLVLFLNSLNPQILILYVVQLAIMIFISRSYPFVYEGMSKVVLNNMMMLLNIGFIMIERLDISSAIRQMIFVGSISFVGLFIPYIIEKFPYFDKFGWIYAGVGIVLLGLVFVIGKEVYGSRNWIVIKGFALQPSEFVKIIFVFFVAAFLAKARSLKEIVKLAMVAAIYVLILVVEKDLGAALIYYITFFMILYVASEKLLYLGVGAVGGMAAAILAYRLFPHVQNRVIAWQDPWGHIDRQGYQVAQSLFAIGTGGWFGMGLGEGLPNKIPVASSDFIISAIAEEMGVFFAICVILVEVSCFVMFINIALKMKRRFYKLTALGLASEFAFQVFLTVGGAVKFIPSTGVTLPLVSYGGSSVISTMVLFGIIQGMYVLNREEVEKNEQIRSVREQQDEKRTKRWRKRPTTERS